MTTTSKTMRVVSLGDRFAGLSVIVLTLIALALGWLLKSTVESRSLPFNSGSITAQVPSGWLALHQKAGEILHVTDRTTTGFGTTYIIQLEAVPAGAKPGEILGLLTLERGNSLTAYRVVSQQQVLVQGRTALQIDYVYVESAANLNNAVMPSVVRGQDYVFVNGSQAVIVTYRADQSAFDADLGRFYQFLVSVKY